MYLLSMIERYLRESGTTASRFGREVMGDPGFVATLRRGREPRDGTVRRVQAYIVRARQSAATGR
ncbi:MULTISPECIES: hypothetical protein [unclassified Sphingomonas]|uniref:hypothetical protein n=1 Tax=unclassified Sphingomonas TaxID=196159 RepID=UPI0006FDFB38|nr:MULTISPECIES: hypothetical protein [unclassified Sphingomonas]KQX19545.1 hypothetical protein ASD17_13615 [Sphingomonas sp. Root1294]KQY65746.1 hypothetical protein ASD39_16815 [Sphingomonas sp. Root50]KRB94948.1 hypothetical protein ASE22_03240 [Sphingomonas sp. Root720]